MQSLSTYPEPQQLSRAATREGRNMAGAMLAAAPRSSLWQGHPESLRLPPRAATGDSSSGAGAAAPGFTLRRGRPEDQQRIQAMVFAEMMTPLSLQPERFTLAVDDSSGELLGFGQLVPISSGVYEIRSVVVVKAQRRRGVGTAVVRALLEQAGEGAAVYLTTIEGPNLEFYRRLGLREAPTPGFLVAEQLAGGVVTQLLFKKRCLVLGRPGSGGQRA